jgi:hypothetical protein
MNQQAQIITALPYIQTMRGKIRHARQYRPENVAKYETELREWIKRYNPNPAPTYKQLKTQ